MSKISARDESEKRPGTGEAIDQVAEAAIARDLALRARDKEIAAEAKQRARERHSYLRSSIVLPKVDAATSANQIVKDGVAISGITGLSGLKENLENVVTPPPNFARVDDGIYRCSFPKKEHFAHLKRLGIRTILTLVPEDYPDDNVNFMVDNGIMHYQVPMTANKEPFLKIDPMHVVKALCVIMDKRNHPILIHCNKGKHRTGCTVGCFRKIQQWAMASIIKEYRDHSEPKIKNRR